MRVEDKKSSSASARMCNGLLFFFPLCILNNELFNKKLKYLVVALD